MLDSPQFWSLITAACGLGLFVGALATNFFAGVGAAALVGGVFVFWFLAVTEDSGG